MAGRGIFGMVVEVSGVDGKEYNAEKMKARVVELNDSQLRLYRRHLDVLLRDTRNTEKMNEWMRSANQALLDAVQGEFDRRSKIWALMHADEARTARNFEAQQRRDVAEAQERQARLSRAVSFLFFRRLPPPLVA